MMKTIQLSILLIVLSSCFACSQKSDLKQVEFLIGTWKMEGKENYESWERKDNELLGISYKIENGEKTISETIVMHEERNHIIYTPTVLDQNNGKGIPFQLKYSKEKLFSFENPSLLQQPEVFLMPRSFFEQKFHSLQGHEAGKTFPLDSETEVGHELLQHPSWQ